jgi:hypothetical protein
MPGKSAIICTERNSNLEIGSTELDLMKPIFNARRNVRIMAAHIGRISGDFAKFKTFEMQEGNDATLL